jgi:hypothetical protein
MMANFTNADLMSEDMHGEDRDNTIQQLSQHLKPTGSKKQVKFDLHHN